MGEILDCFYNGIEFIKSHQQEVIPDSYDNCEPSFKARVLNLNLPSTIRKDYITQRNYCIRQYYSIYMNCTCNPKECTLTLVSCEKLSHSSLPKTTRPSNNGFFHYYVTLIKVVISRLEAFSVEQICLVFSFDTSVVVPYNYIFWHFSVALSKILPTAVAFFYSIIKGYYFVTIRGVT